MAWARQQPGEMHWSKDFVEHLRTVHFALIVTCVALIVLKTSITASTYQKARDQIDLVRKLAPAMNGNTFANEADKLYSASNRGDTRTSSKTYRHGSEVVRVSLSRREVFVVAEAPWHGPEPPRAHPGYPLTTTKWASSIGYGPSSQLSLEEFKRAWDTINKQYLLGSCNGYTAPELVRNHDLNTLFTEDGTTNKKSTDAYLECSAESEDDYAVEEELGARRPQNTGDSDPLLVLSDTGHSVIVGLLDQDYVPFLPLDALRAQFPDLPHGKFSEAFAELDELTSGLQSDKIDELRTWVSSQESQHSSESFEAFGVHFPADATVGWGTFVVLAVQV